MTVEVSPKWDAFANWLITDDSERDRLNLPKSQEQYALSIKTTGRQLRRWKSEPMFKALVEKKLNAKNKKLGISTISVDGTPTILEQDGEENQALPEDDYQQIKETLVKGALTGDPKYLDLYFKTYGKDFVAEESAARSSDLAGFEMQDLILEALTAISIEEVLAFLREKGYTVIGGDSSDQ